MSIEDTLTLGELIDLLRSVDSDLVVSEGFGTGVSWRGAYNELAFAPRFDVSVGVMLAEATLALGRTYRGYKGGDFLMEWDTPVHLAGWGEIGQPLTVSRVNGWIKARPIYDILFKLVETIHDVNDVGIALEKAEQEIVAVINDDPDLIDRLVY